MYCLGLDMGASSVRGVLLDQEKRLVALEEIAHQGEPLLVLLQVLEQLGKQHQIDEIEQVMVTGVNAVLLEKAPASLGRVGSIPAIQAGAEILCPTAASLIEIGSQCARYLTSLHQGSPPRFALNENCAGGTGSFFETQMRRLGLSMEDYSGLVEAAQTAPRLSGKCSVFAKTDIIHHQLEGAATADILLGLCYAVVRNYKALIVGKLPVNKPLALCGGLVRNSGVVQAVREIFQLDEEELLVQESYAFVQAVGAASLGGEGEKTFGGKDLMEFLARNTQGPGGFAERRGAPLLSLLPGTSLSPPEACCPQEPFDCALGIDVGSTSTKLVLVSKGENLADCQYRRTGGNPERAVREGLASIQHRLGSLANITAVGITGSGRYRIGKLVGADLVVDEITAQARGAVYGSPQVDTVFEIGGQDSKYIALNNGVVVDFQMNKICAAGTGSFMEEQTERMGIDRKEIGHMAISARNPLDLGERCTVFMENNITAYLASGAKKEDIIAGLCHATVNNYLHKVVGQKPIGKQIVLQGGVAYNAGIVAAFQQHFGERLQVLPHFPVSGAIGAALLAKQAQCGETSFLGLDLEKAHPLETILNEDQAISNKMFYQQSQDLLLEGYAGIIEPSKETVGVPRVLVMHKFFPMVNQFFRQLGFNVLISSETHEDIVAMSQCHAKTETCYPVKLIYGHMMELVEKGVDYIFLPRVHTMRHEKSHVHHNYGCVYMQTAPILAAQALGLEERGIRLLSPQFSLDFGQLAMVEAMLEVGRNLKKDKKQCVKALEAGAAAVKHHTAQVEEQGRRLMASLKPDEKVLVLITRAYGIADPVLNMGIPKLLLGYGYKVITLAHLPAHDLDISTDHPNLYWPFGQHIISGAKLVRSHPNLYAVYLTSHGCGPDTMLTHLFAEEMGDKPYLHIEVDEHVSQVGLVTRIEAFLNSLQCRPVSVDKEPGAFSLPPSVPTNIHLKPAKGVPLYLPSLWPYSAFICALLQRRGFSARTLPPFTSESLAVGREETHTKEYLSFTALLGAVLQQVETAEPEAQFLIPSTEGAETDGMYSRCIRTVLDRKGYRDAGMVSPIIETLPATAEGFEELFFALLAGDLIWMVPPEIRPVLAVQYQRRFAQSPVVLEDLLAWAEHIRKMGFKEAKAISVIGEPPCLFEGRLNHHLWEEMERMGFWLCRMPLSEYGLFLWKERGGEKAFAGKVDCCTEQLSQLAGILRNKSPFSPDWRELYSVANQFLPRFAGAGGSYRYAKCEQELGRGRAVIMGHSLYENTGSILAMLQPDSRENLLELAFDDTEGLGARERLHTFLHFHSRMSGCN